MSKEALGWNPNMNNLPDIVKYYLGMKQEQIPSRGYNMSVVIRTLCMLERHGQLRLTTVETSDDKPLMFYKLINHD